MTASRNPARGTVRSGSETAERAIIFAFGLLRALQLLSGLAVLSFRSHSYRTQALWVVVLLLAVVAGWSAWVWGRARRRGRLLAATIWADVVICAVALVVIGLATRSGEAETWANWAFAVATSSALLAGATMTLSLWPLGVAILIATHVGGAWPELHSGAASVSNAIGNEGSLLMFGAIGYLVAWYLRSNGRRLDEAAVAALVAERAQAAQTARYDDRIEQYRTLHDTVLSTLTAISRGGLDYDSADVRQRCTQDASYLRRLIQGEVDGAACDLERGLREVVNIVEGRQLTVDYLSSGLPDDLPAAAITALCGATREALTNVERHSGSTTAWVTARGEPGAVIVQIVDQGTGFEYSGSEPGLGIRSSIVGRLRDAGGQATVSTGVGYGSSIELRLPLSPPPLPSLSSSGGRR